MLPENTALLESWDNYIAVPNYSFSRGDHQVIVTRLKGTVVQPTKSQWYLFDVCKCPED